MTSGEDWKFFGQLLHAAAERCASGSDLWKALKTLAVSADGTGDFVRLGQEPPLDLTDEVCGETYELVVGDLSGKRRCTLPPGHAGPHGRKA